MNRNRRLRIFLAIVVLAGLGFFLAGNQSLTGITSNIVKEKEKAPPRENTTVPKAYFCPDDDCMGAIISIISTAGSSVHCAFYDLDLEHVIDALARADRNGIDVKIVMDTDNYNTNEQALSIIAKDIITDDRSAYMHDKFCIIDNSIVSTGSFNPTERGNFRNNNNLVVLHSKYLSENYEDEFQELWTKAYGKQSNVRYPMIYLNDALVENYFCPEDCREMSGKSGISHDHSGQERIADLIDNADMSILFMTFSFTHDGIGDAIISAAERGVNVSGVFEKSQNNQWNEYEKMQDAGLDVFWDGNPANMHHKVFIIDNEIVITGSTNPSSNGFGANDENILIIHDSDIAGQFTEEFHRVLEEAVSEE